LLSIHTPSLLFFLPNKHQNIASSTLNIKTSKSNISKMLILRWHILYSLKDALFDLQKEVLIILTQSLKQD
jgi:hypothetical protein